MDRVPVKIDWSNLRHDPELDKLLTPQVRPSGAELARRFEHDVLEYMLAMHLDKIYIWDETTSNGTTWRWEMHYGATRPENKACREHDFTNLIQMSDEEFDKLVESLPTSPNEELVRQWRREMKDEQ